MIKLIRKGFTLVELVVVIAIIAILAAVSTGGYFVYIAKAQEVEAINLGYTISNYVKTLQNPVTFDSNFSKPTKPFPARNFTFTYSSKGLNIKLNYLWYKNNKGIIIKYEDDKTKFGSIGAISGALSRFLSFYYETKEIIYDGNNKRVDSSDPTAERYAIGYGNSTNHITLGTPDTHGIYNDVMVQDKKSNSSKATKVTERGIFIGNQSDPKQIVPSLKDIGDINSLKELNLHELYYISSWNKAYLIKF